MEPLTRVQLQNAHAALIAERERIAHREQELNGQLAAEVFYKDIRRIAQAGGTYASSKSMELGVAYDTMYAWILEHFPDCTISREVRHIGNSPTYAIRVDWRM
jgi:hypothetical protein